MLEEAYCPNYFRTYVSVNLDAVQSNIKAVRQKIGLEKKIMAVIKADAYGHGAVVVAKALRSLVWGFGVAIVEEAIELRKAGITEPILVLGTVVKEQIPEIVAYDITTTVFSTTLAQEIAKQAKKMKKTAKIHIKLDTGMGRIGYQPKEDKIAEIVEISKMQGLYLEGLFTHFATSDEHEKSYAKGQLHKFVEFISKLQEQGVNIPIKHAANSAAIIDMPDSVFDMVRCGIATYGLYPSKEVEKTGLPLTPALEWKTQISYIKDLDSGYGISYGITFMTKTKTTVATIPIGYADGYPRSLSNLGSVLIHGKRVPIIGRICMDQFMVDVTQVKEAALGDEVTLVGKDGDEFLSVEEVADLAGSFNYELLCNIGKRVPRIYQSNKKPYLVRKDYESYSKSLTDN